MYVTLRGVIEDFAVLRSPPTKRFHSPSPPCERRISLLLTTSLYTNCSMVEVLGTKAAKEVDKSANQNPSVLSVGLAVGIVEGRAEGLLDGTGAGL